MSISVLIVSDIRTIVSDILCDYVQARPSRDCRLLLRRTVRPEQPNSADGAISNAWSGIVDSFLRYFKGNINRHPFRRK